MRSFVFLFVLPVLFASPRAAAQNTYRPGATGYLNFNLEKNSQKDTSRQTLSVFGCNTSITVNSKFWHGPKSFEWNKPNQVLSGIPFGHQTDSVTKEPFYISKYYIASPPVFHASGIKDTNTLYDIGLVTPDEFELRGDKPAQLVYLNYDVLQPMYIEYFPLTFDTSFQRLGVSLVPFKVECKDFPWSDSSRVPAARGASGIGAIDRKSGDTARLFLPYYYAHDPKEGKRSPGKKKYLDCEVNILNDILFHYEVYFKVNGKKYSSINLKDFQGQHPTILLCCEYREKLPCGCIGPGTGKD